MKIYKTSAMLFKDRARYIEHEFRHRHTKIKGNSMKIVSIWAEKELRNLKRLAFCDGLVNFPKP
jgi:RIO kinase 1